MQCTGSPRHGLTRANVECQGYGTRVPMETDGGSMICLGAGTEASVVVVPGLVHYFPFFNPSPTNSTHSLPPTHCLTRHLISLLLRRGPSFLYFYLVQYFYYSFYLTVAIEDVFPLLLAPPPFLELTSPVPRPPHVSHPVSTAPKYSYFCFCLSPAISVARFFYRTLTCA